MVEANGLHPSPEQLSAFALGKLGEDQIPLVARHLSDCAACSDTAATATDSFLDLLRPDPGGQLDLQALPPALRHHCLYRILRCLGQGGMGTVYLAEHRLMKQQRAIKVINPALTGNVRAVERFVREAELLPKLQHPNIVQAHGAEKADGLYLLVMEYVEGETLADVIERQGPLPFGLACEYTRQAAMGLQYAHEQGLVHRDIKPANLMWTTAGQIKILDFGLARLRSQTGVQTGLTHEHAAMGTPDYSAPEQALDARHADICADIYSLGCTLFYLLTGKPPFGKPSALAVSVAHLHEPPPSLRQLRPDAPTELCDLVSRMLAKLPGQRPQTPAEVAAALLPFAAGASQPHATDQRHVPSGSPRAARTEGERTVRTAAVLRRRIVWGALAALVALAGIGLWVGGALKVKTSHGIIVLEDLPAAAEVMVDGETVTLAPGDGKTIAITAGKKHQLQVKKEGFQVFGREVEIDAGARRSIVVRLQREAAPPKPARPAIQPDFVEEFDQTKIGQDTADTRYGSRDGAYYIESHQPGNGRGALNFRNYKDGILEVRGRICKGFSRGAVWIVNLENQEHKHGIQVSIGDGQLWVQPSMFDKKPEAGPKEIHVKHAAIRPAGEWNTLRLVIDGKTLGVYVNGERVCAPIIAAFPNSPYVMALGNNNSERNARVEFDRYVLWPTTDIQQLP